MEKIKVGLEMCNSWTDPPIQIMVIIAAMPISAIVSLLLAYYVSWFTLPVIPLGIWVYYNFIYLRTPPADTTKYLRFNDPTLKKMFSNRKIPICMLYEAYILEQVDFVGDVYDALLHRDEYLCYRPTWCLIKFLIEQVLPSKSSSFHGKKDDAKQIHLHYDRGNDFFNAFLGESMIYTCAVYHGLDQSLETAQENKCSLICDKLQVKPGDNYLDIGCGWGTLARHAVQKYGAKGMAVTLSKEGAAWCREQNQKAGLTEEQLKICNHDYRDIVGTKCFERISSIEMAEHVGLANFPSYLAEVKQLLTDQGMFLMQVSGLRKGSNWEDVQWGLFMSKYIFPGADASTPLNWYVKQMESAGLEVRSVETIGRHYSHTIHGWYDNWMKNREKVLPKYGENLYRLWTFFLAWSVIASGQGSATCYQLLAHKNTYKFDRDVFCGIPKIKHH